MLIFMLQSLHEIIKDENNNRLYTNDVIKSLNLLQAKNNASKLNKTNVSSNVLNILNNNNNITNNNNGNNNYNGNNDGSNNVLNLCDSITNCEKEFLNLVNHMPNVKNNTENEDFELESNQKSFLENLNSIRHFVNETSNKQSNLKVIFENRMLPTNQLINPLENKATNVLISHNFPNQSPFTSQPQKLTQKLNTNLVQLNQTPNNTLFTNWLSDLTPNQDTIDALTEKSHKLLFNTPQGTPAFIETSIERVFMVV